MTQIKEQKEITYEQCDLLHETLHHYIAYRKHQLSEIQKELKSKETQFHVSQIRTKETETNDQHLLLLFEISQKIKSNGNNSVEAFQQLTDQLNLFNMIGLIQKAVQFKVELLVRGQDLLFQDKSFKSNEYTEIVIKSTEELQAQIMKINEALGDLWSSFYKFSSTS